MKDKYPITGYYGIPVHTDNSGNYVLKENARVHLWRNGKHTKGKFEKIGQLFLTENNLLVLIVATQKMKFKDRHDLVPFERFTKELIDGEVLEQALSIYKGM